MQSANRLIDSQENLGESTKLLFFGGGRWAKIVLKVLRAQISGTTRVVWVTHHNADSAREWVAKRGDGCIDVASECPASLGEFSGAIVATSVDRHYSLTHRLLEHRVPVLCEKPIATSREQLDTLRRLSKQGDCPLGIHLEFAYLHAFDDFLELVQEIKIERIEVDWFDPAVELRDGVEKRPEFQCDIVSDQLPHIWSLVSRVSPNQNGLRIDSVNYSPAKTVVKGSVGDVGVQFQLSRRQQTRRRCIILNQGEATFDFTVEPPTALYRGRRLDLPLGLFRPLELSLASFLAQLTRGTSERGSSVGKDRLGATGSSEKLKASWPLSLENQFRFLLECLKGSELLKKSQDQYASGWFSRQPQGTLNSAKLTDHQIAFFIDRWLPETVQAGQWVVPTTLEEERDFAMETLNRRGDWGKSE